MAFDNLADFLDRLEESGELHRVSVEVDPRNEIGAICRKLNITKGPAVLFEKVKGSKMPLVSQLLATNRRLALALDCDERNLFGDALKRSANLIPPRLVDRGPCQEVVKYGRQVDLNEFPLVTNNPDDGGRYLTAGHVILKDPELGYNLAIYRMMCRSRNEVNLRFIPSHHGWAFLKKAEERGRSALPVAVALGVDPAIYIASQFEPRIGANELEIAGALRNKAVDMVKCKTIDLEVPANTSIVIEGFCPPPPDNKIDEGPMMEFTDYSGTATVAIPYMEVTAITMRRQPVFHTTMSGNSEEHRVGCIWSFFGYEQMALTLIKKQFHHVTGIGIMAGSHGFHAVVSLKKTYEGEDRQVLNYLLSTQYFKYVTVVDDDVDPHNSEQVEWAKACRAGRTPDDFVVFPRLPTWEMDPEIDKHWQVTKLGILATRAIDEKYEVPTPDRNVMERMRPIYEKCVAR